MSEVPLNRRSMEGFLQIFKSAAHLAHKKQHPPRTPVIRNSTPLGPYIRTMSRALWTP